MLIENFVSEFAQLLAEVIRDRLQSERSAAMAFEETAQNIVQQLARVDRLQIERRLAAWFELQNSLTKKLVSTVSVETKPAGAVHKLRTESLVQQRD